MKEKPLRMFISLIFLVISYEWLISGLNKVLNGHFIVDLHKQYLQSIPDIQYSFYARFLKAFCLPHCIILGGLVEYGEVLLGISYIILAIYMFKGKTNNFISTLGIGTGLISAFMTLNFFLFQGGSIFLNPSEPFDEGISIDLILFLLQLGISVFYYLMISSNRKFHTQTQQ